MRARAIMLMVLLGLTVLPRVAQAGVIRQIDIWWAEGSLASAKWWRNHYADAERGLGRLIADVQAAIDGEVEFVQNGIIDRAWYVAKRTTVAGVLRKMERGEYSDFVAQDVNKGHLEACFKSVSFEPFGPSAAGKARAVTAAVTLQEAAVADLRRKLDWVKAAHARKVSQVAELDAKLRWLQGLPPAATASTIPPAPPNHTSAPRSDIQLLGVR